VRSRRVPRQKSKERKRNKKSNWENKKIKRKKKTT